MPRSIFFENPDNPLTHTPYGRTVVGGLRIVRAHDAALRQAGLRPDRDPVDGEEVPVTERVVWERPFCRVISFDRGAAAARRRSPKLLIVAPMSGHYATLLRGTVEAFLPTHQVCITDWTDARMVPLAEGRFDLDDYIDYLIPMFRELGPDLHVMAVCQPAVPGGRGGRPDGGRERPVRRPRSMTLMGGPIDTRRSPTAVNLRRGGARHRLVQAATASPRCRRPIRASGATSIRASCSCPASWP